MSREIRPSPPARPPVWRSTVTGSGHRHRGLRRTDLHLWPRTVTYPPYSARIPHPDRTQKCWDRQPQSGLSWLRPPVYNPWHPANTAGRLHHGRGQGTLPFQTGAYQPQHSSRRLSRPSNTSRSYVCSAHGRHSGRQGRVWLSHPHQTATYHALSRRTTETHWRRGYCSATQRVHSTFASISPFHRCQGDRWTSTS